jgi:uncharacterized protein
MTARAYTVLENEWIPLPDGSRLAARIWMPEGTGADPVPAVLEYLPYRKRDGTSPRDESTYPSFAEAGIAGVRVDIRGCGESPGVIDGEYTARELADACDVIAWIAAQPWCNGSVGMMGISWGGFNALQVAALRPPALRAVISIASTVDRYNDDIHYKDGCHLSAQMGWAATMQAYSSRPPDPALVGEDWRAMWMERLEGAPNLMAEWLSHQRRDAFWEQGSICEDFSAVEVPALVIAGWADGYRNTPMKAVEGLGPKAKALIGPWVHKYPHFAWPKPRADFLGEAIAWWNRWLRGEENGAEDGPQMRAYLIEGARPKARRDFDPGRWVAMEEWQAPAPRPWHVEGGALVEGEAAGEGAALYLRSPLDTGTMSGEFFTLKPDAEMAGDQRVDDAGSLTWETAPLGEALDLLGRATLDLTVSCEADLANLCARLVDVHPDGTATRIAFGVLNLAHRGGNAEPKAMPHGEPVTVRITLDACGWRLLPGHRLRLSLSTAYWPMILPPPVDAGVAVETGSLRLGLPVAEGLAEVAVPEPANPDPLPRYIEHAAGRTERSVTRALDGSSTAYRILEDGGRHEHPATGLSTREVRDETWTIGGDDPLSLKGEALWTIEKDREGWSVRTESRLALACTATDWLISGEVAAFEGGREVFRRPWAERVPRDHM